MTTPPRSRRHFLRSATAAATLLPTLALAADNPATSTLPNVFGPRPGYTPQIGTFISERTEPQKKVPLAKAY